MLPDLPYVIGLDLSLTSSGVATVTPDGDVSLRLVKSSGHKADSFDARGDRLRAVVDAIVTPIPSSSAVAVELPVQTTGGAVLDRAGLFWLVVSALQEAGCSVTPINNAHRAMYALPTTGAKRDKDAVLGATIRRYIDVPVTNNDDADALLLAAMLRRRLGAPLEREGAFTPAQMANVAALIERKVGWLL